MKLGIANEGPEEHQDYAKNEEHSWFTMWFHIALFWVVLVNWEQRGREVHWFLSTLLEVDKVVGNSVTPHEEEQDCSTVTATLV